MLLKKTSRFYEVRSSPNLCPFCVSPQMYRWKFINCFTCDTTDPPAGDLTEIGEKGVTLSGGQKQRISLARAVYYTTNSNSNNHIILLDDVLSAVDAHVGKHIFHSCILDYLQGKTRIFVTHQLQYLPYVDNIIVMENGKIRLSGSYTQLIESGFDFINILKDQKKATDNQSMDDGDEEEQQERDPVDNSFAWPTATGKVSSQEQELLVDLSEDEKKEVKSEAEMVEQGKLVEDEERITGAVKWSVYKKYLISCGGILFLCFLLTVSVLLEVLFTVLRFLFFFFLLKTIFSPQGL